MKTRILLAIAGAAALAAIPFNANASTVYLTPRAEGNQLSHFAGTYHDPNLVNTTGVAIVSPRAEGNQMQVATGATAGTTPAAACVKTMAGSPKSIQACTEHPATMPGCHSPGVASTK